MGKHTRLDTEPSFQSGSGCGGWHKRADGVVRIRKAEEVGIVGFRMTANGSVDLQYKLRPWVSL